MQAKDFMTPNPVFCCPQNTVEEAGKLMAAENVGFLPVVESKSCKKILGVITDRDIVVRVIAAGKDSSITKVEEVMTKEIITTHLDTTIKCCLEDMEDTQVRRLVVLNPKGECAGVISEDDLAVYCSEIERAGLVKELSRHIVSKVNVRRTGLSKPRMPQRSIE